MRQWRYKTRQETRYGTNSTLNVKSEFEVTGMDNPTRLHVEVLQLRESNAHQKRLIKKLKESNRATLHLNRKLGNLALKDPHTGLYNRRHFNETLEFGLLYPNVRMTNLLKTIGLSWMTAACTILMFGSPCVPSYFATGKSILGWFDVRQVVRHSIGMTVHRSPLACRGHRFCFKKLWVRRWIRRITIRFSR